MVFERKIVRSGSLARLAPLFKEIDTSAELANAAYIDEITRNQWFYTANFAMYRIESGRAILYFGGRDANPIYSNLDEVCGSLIDHQRYRPSDAEITAIQESVESGLTLRFDLVELALQKQGSESGFFQIETTQTDALNSTQRQLAEKVFGEGQDFFYNMEILNQARIYEARIFLLTVDFLKGHLQENDADIRPSQLFVFDNYTKFMAVDANVANISAMYGLPVIPADEEEQF